MKAIWNGHVLAESSETINVEGNEYFPLESIKLSFFDKNDHHTLCPWKGIASYYDIVVDGKTNASAAWFYSEPKSAASNIKNYIAFWRGVQVTEN